MKCKLCNTELEYLHDRYYFDDGKENIPVCLDCYIYLKDKEYEKNHKEE